MDNVRIMPTRLDGINNAIAGIDKSDVYGIAFTQKNSFFSAGWDDDQGIYIFSQFVHKIFSLTSIEAINLFYIITISLGFILFTIGIFLLFQNIKTRIVSMFVIVTLTALTYIVSDVYIMFYFSSSFIFLFLYIINKKLSFKLHILLLLVFGFLLGASNIFRAHSSTAIVLFMISYLILSKLNKKRIVVMLSSLLIGLMMVSFFWNNIITQPKNIYLKNTKTIAPITLEHPFWHSVYIGLGYIQNPYVPQYLDTVAHNKVKSINPKAKYLSQEYEDILKKETFKFIMQHPIIFFQNIGAKLGAMILYALVFMNIGLYWVIKNITLKEFIPFGLAISFNSLFGFLVIPHFRYLLGFFIIIASMSIYFYGKEFKNINNKI